MVFRADLHCHTSCSDGLITPAELCLEASKQGLQGLSITDHDSIAAYPAACGVADALDLLLLPGVEFSAFHHGVTVHILGYGFAVPNRVLEDFCQRHLERRRLRNNRIIEKLAQLGIDIDPSFLGEDRAVGRCHIAQALVQGGWVNSVKEAFQRYIGDGKPAYYRGPVFSASETIDVIHQSGGMAILAHPHLIKSDSAVDSLLTLPFDGLEAYYARFYPEQERRWLKVAEKHQWLVTGGSDFHGNIKPRNTLGCSWVGRDTFDILWEHYQKNGESGEIL
ncbi:MAG: PHP domain-containing protein [Chlamydiota bacterium]